MASRRFWAGGSVEAVPAGARQRIFSRAIVGPGVYVELHGFGCGSQGGNGDFLMELINGGRTLISETFNFGIATSGYALPFLRFEAHGLLELFVNYTGAAPSTISAHVDGFYVSRP